MPKIIQTKGDIQLNLEEFRKLVKLLKDNGYKIKDKYPHSKHNTKLTFKKKIPTDDKDIFIYITGEFDYFVMGN